MTDGNATDVQRETQLHRIGGIAVFVGVAGLLLQQALDTRLPPGPSGSGDVEGFLVIAVFTGIAITLLGAVLYRAQLYHPVIGSSGVVLGLEMIIAEIVPRNVVDLSPLDTP